MVFYRGELASLNCTKFLSYVTHEIDTSVSLLPNFRLLINMRADGVTVGERSRASPFGACKQAT